MYSFYATKREHVQFFAYAFGAQPISAVMSQINDWAFESSRPGLPLADNVIPQEDLQDQPALFESTLGPAPEQIKLSEPELPTLFFGCATLGHFVRHAPHDQERQPPTD